MADKRICELVQATDINDAAFLACDDAVDGTKKLSIEQLTTEGEFVKEFKGECLAAVPTYEGSLLLKKMYGMSLQDGTPTPSSPVAIKSAKANFKNCGKNLLKLTDFDSYRTNANVIATVVGNTITLNGTATSNAANPSVNPSAHFLRAKVGDVFRLRSFILDGECTTSDGIGFYLYTPNGNKGFGNFAPVNGKVSKGATAFADFTITASDLDSDGWWNIYGAQIWMNTGEVFNDLKVGLSVELLNTSEDYEEYRGQTVTTNLTLRAIEVASTDTYNFVKDGKYYIADTLEKTAEGYQITRRIGEIVVDSSKTIISWGNGITETTFGFKTGISYDVSGETTNYRDLPTLCDKFSWAIKYPQALNFIYCQTWVPDEALIFYFKIDNTIASDLTAVKNWLTINTITVIYPLDHPTVESVATDDVYKLLNLKSYNEATYLAQTADIEGYAILEYGTSESATEALTGYVKAEKADNGDVILFKEESITEPGTSEGAAILKKMYGMSVQDGTPTPSNPVDIENSVANFVETGKNIIPYPYYHQSGRESNGVIFTVNEDGSITANGSNTAASSSQFDLCDNIKNLLKPGQKYKLSANGGIYGTCQVFMDYQTTSSSWGTLIASAESEVVFTMPDDFSTYAKFRIMMSVSAGKSVSNLTLKPILTIYEANDTDYLPYKGNSITTDLTLRAIEVTANYNYNLVKDGKYYIADTLEKIDGGYQITRRVGQYTFNNDGWGVSQGYIYFLTNPANIFDIKLPSSSAQNPYVLNKFYVSKAQSELTSSSDNVIYCDANFCIIDRRGLSVSDFKTFINGSTIDFIKATPTVETVTDANAIKLLSFKSYDEATYIVQTATVEGVMEIDLPLTKAAGYATMGAAKAESNEIRIEALES